MSEKSAPYYCSKCGHEPEDQSLFDNPDTPCPECGPVNLGNIGEAKLPDAERITIPWVFRAGCHLVTPGIAEGRLMFGLILDLGFGTFKEISGVLHNVQVVEGMDRLVLDFASNWAANGIPNDLSCSTLGRAWGLIWHVELRRCELHGETLKVLNVSSLADALIEQGIAHRIENKDWPEA